METAVLEVVSDVLLAADWRDVTLLGLLDLSAAFDTVDHEILINHLQTSIGIRGKCYHEYYPSFPNGFKL